MKKGIVLMVLVLVSFFTPLSPIQPVSAFGFSASQFWFYVDEPTTIEHPEMYFIVSNVYNFPIAVQVSYEKIEGINIMVDFDWENTTIEVGDSMKNNYRISVESNFSVVHLLRIYIRFKQVDTSDSMVSVGGIVVNRITYYSREDAFLLNLRVVDQAKALRNSTINIMFRENNSISWSPIKYFNGTGYTGYLPEGNYLIQAEDLKSGKDGEILFTLNNDTDIDLELNLIGFNIFKVILVKYVGINFTIDNYADVLYNVEIYGNLLFNGEQISETTKIEMPEFPTTIGFAAVLRFDSIVWEKGQYSFVGIIKSNGIVVATKVKKYNFVPTCCEATSNKAQIGLMGVTIFLVVASVFIGVIEFKKRRIISEDV